MAAYQQTSKRQKVREARVDAVDYFQNIEKLEFNNMTSPHDTSSYRYYSAGERLMSRTMEDWLRLCVSLTEFRSSGHDNQRPGQSRPWDDHTDSLENHKRCIKALFDFCAKVGIRYWTAFDTDLVPDWENWEEFKSNLDEIVEYIQELQLKTHLKLMWLAPDLYSHSRYASGAFTSNEANSYTQAATQIKKCLEVSQRLNAECFLIWPYSEGYYNVLQTDLQREMKLFAKLLKYTADFKERQNYRCQLLIMPYYKLHKAYNWMRENEVLFSYMWDVTSCLYLLKCNNLDRFYKVCSAPGHHLFMANVYNMLGGVILGNNQDQNDIKKLTLTMKCIVDQGAATSAGINLRLRPRRDADLKDMVSCYMKYIDYCGKALRAACNAVAEQVFSKHLQQRYVSYYSGLGSRLASGEVSLDECEEFYKKNQQHTETSSKSEQYDVILQRYIDASDRV